MKCSFLYLIALIVFTPLHAQWMQTNGPYGGYVQAIAVAVNGVGDTNIFLGTSGGVFRSTNNGTSWTGVNSGLLNEALYVRALEFDGSNLYAGTTAGVFRSTNNGANWTETNTGLTNPFIYTFAVSGANLFAGTWGGGVFLSTNYGSTWNEVNTGLINKNVMALLPSGTYLFAGTDGGGVYRSTDNGSNWTAVDSGLNTLRVSKLLRNGTSLFAGTLDGGLYVSIDSGTSWKTVNSGLNGNTISGLASIDSTIFVANNFGNYKSTDNGTSWIEINNGLNDTRMLSIAASGSNIFAGTHTGIYISTNNGTNWYETNAGLTNLTILSLIKSGGNLLAGAEKKIYLSTDNGSIWTRTATESWMNDVTAYTFIEGPNGSSGTNLYAGGSNMARSTDNGISWSLSNNGITGTFVNSLAASGTNIFAGTDPSGVFLSTNYGGNWSAINTGLSNKSIRSIAASGTTLLAANYNGGIYRSTDNGANWAFVNGSSGIDVNSFLVVGDNIFAGSHHGVHKSTDGGITWILTSNGITLYGDYISSIVISGDYLFAGGARTGVFLSSDSGAHWTPVNNGLNGAAREIYSLVINGANIYAGTTASIHVAQISSIIPPHIPQSLVVTDSSYNTFTLRWRKNSDADFLQYHLYYGTSPNPSTLLATITDINDTSITLSGLNARTKYYFRITAVDSLMNESGYSNEVTGTPFHIYSFSVNWLEADFGEVIVGTSRDTTVVVTNAGSDTLRIYSVNSTNWAFSARRSSLQIAPGKSAEDTVRFTPTKLGADSAMVIITSNSPTSPDTIMVYGTGVNPTSVARFQEVPKEYSLEQNYPNPFNPSTKIMYGLPFQSFVVLKVYDIVGREVAVLVNEEQSAGWKEVRWNAINFASGIYFYKLTAHHASVSSALSGQAENYSEVKKLILLK